MILQYLGAVPQDPCLMFILPLKMSFAGYFPVSPDEEIVIVVIVECADRA